MLCVHAGPETEEVTDGSVTHLSLRRSALSLSMDEGLAFDPLFQRHMSRVARKFDAFLPELVHITGLNDVSIVGAVLAWRRRIPVIASWHTNLHEFAARRLGTALRPLPDSVREGLTAFAERKIFDGAMLYYRMPRMILAPNEEQVELIARRTRRETRLMSRGVDTELFSPLKRTVNDGKLRLGFVGRLRAEKNPRMLVEVEQRLLAAGVDGFEFTVVGEGTERRWLERNLKHAVFTGFLKGEDLARAYADMDVFLFPSETDSFGNVAQEALASGVPTVVSDRGGPKFVIRHGETGFVAGNAEEFADHVLALVKDRPRLALMKEAARGWALTRSWESVFQGVWEAYRDTLDRSRRTA